METLCSKMSRFGSELINSTHCFTAENSNFRFNYCLILRIIKKILSWDMWYFVLTFFHRIYRKHSISWYRYWDMKLAICGWISSMWPRRHGRRLVLAFSSDQWRSRKQPQSVRSKHGTVTLSICCHGNRRAVEWPLTNCHSSPPRFHSVARCLAGCHSVAPCVCESCGFKSFWARTHKCFIQFLLSILNTHPAPGSVHLHTDIRTQPAAVPRKKITNNLS